MKKNNQQPPKQLYAALRRLIKDLGGFRAASKHLNYSASHLCDMCAGRKQISSILAESLGWAKEERWVRK